MTSDANVQATFAATLVDEWVRRGVEHAVVAPGSRSTPLAIALWSATGIQVHVQHDERAAAFMALGIGKSGGIPAVLLCTSGTAAAELHPAVVEAHQARVPMLVCTADRPPELQGIGAPQTIDQVRLYGTAVRAFVEPGVADDESRDSWRSIAASAFVDAVGSPPGPVHLNLAFRDPLVGAPGPLPMSAPRSRPTVTSRGGPTESVLEPMTGRGIVVAGNGAGPRFDPGWPVLADPTSGWRVPGSIAAFDALIRSGAMPTPEAVIRLGDPPASKVLAQWLGSLDVPQIAVGEGHADPERTATAFHDAVLPFTMKADEGWGAAWRSADDAAQRAIDSVLTMAVVLTEPFVARTVAAFADTIVVSSSMPIRDLEWYAAPRDGLRVLANRGANGIDGVVSTAVGVAIETEGPVTVLIGDVALLHDSNALLGLAARDLDITIVVVDNRGGGIFEFLPQATSLPRDMFEQLFGTPHDVDIAMLAAAHGISTTRVHEPDGLLSALEIASCAPGTHVVLVRTDRQLNVAVHDEVHAAVAASLSSRG